MCGIVFTMLRLQISGTGPIFRGKPTARSCRQAKCHRTAIPHIFATQSHNCWHRTAVFQIQKKKKTLSQDVCKAAMRWRHDNCSIVQARWTEDDPYIVQTLQDCSTYIVQLTRKVLTRTMLATLVCTSCAHCALLLHRSLVTTKIFQDSHRHCKMPAPGWHHTRTTLAPYSPTLRCLRFPPKNV